eukprot:CAMPEP_0115577900 /NCGR_PEP_ID=MMETSP0272-20121206/3311_1 /TAXON_ID=71861 /ORGANISM="Scrippsiella trochoidea, Strain CCMP3099" /LENGTH=92 /DNA_ID=CAMNT_0003012727 /DNA_START=767 /DNA_END=1045 /DNA_ORIENTATION=-
MPRTMQATMKASMEAPTPSFSADALTTIEAKNTPIDKPPTDARRCRAGAQNNKHPGSARFALTSTGMSDGKAPNSRPSYSLPSRAPPFSYLT